MNQLYDVIIVGGGPAGLSAAYSAWQNGAKKIVVIERDRELGGILQQCIHNGFGLHHFKEELTGPGYAHRCIELVADKPEKADPAAMAGAGMGGGMPGMM